MKLGSFNCYVPMRGEVNGTRFVFDGTTKGLVLSALAVGGAVGEEVRSEFGVHQLVHAPGDHRCGEVWAERVWQKD
jgi:hypothetical protein